MKCNYTSDSNHFFITGSNGFVGTVLAEKLIANGMSVKCTFRNHTKIFSTAKSNFVVENIDAFTSWKSSLCDSEIVIHLAARVHIMDEKSSNPLQAFLDVNFHGTLNLAKQAAAAGVKRFIYVSSIKVNGEYTEDKPFDENDLANPQDHYAVSKWQAEQALRQLSKETAMEIVIIRPPLVYGPGVKANFLRLLNMVNTSVPLPLASINNRRSMVYIGNLVDAIITCAIHPKAANQTYLVSDKESVSTPELIRNIAQALGKRIFLLPFPIFMMKFLARLVGKSAAVDRLTQSLVIDSSKISQELDWTPPFTMAQGLEATAEWFKSQQ